MTVVNPASDNVTLWAAMLNAFANAHGAGGIVSECSISKGTGDWDIDVTAGTIIEANTEASITADTVTLSDASGLSAGESRVDLIHADTGDAIATTEGTGAADPVSPDIPASEVLLGFVVVSEGDSTVADSDIFDVPALRQNDSVLYNIGGSHELTFAGSPYGDGSDGSITRSANLNENGIIESTDYTLESGNTATVTNGVLVIHATDSITINGTIDASGQGAGSDTAGWYTRSDGSGGAGGTSSSDDGDNGGEGAGGGGGFGDGRGSGDDGNDAPAFDINQRRFDPTNGGNFTVPPGVSVILLPNLNPTPGSGGGSGGDGAGGISGGAGGSGGGYVALIAPDITIGGTIDVSGGDGSNGSSASAGTNSGGGGGGAGGAGGVIELVYRTLTENTPTYTTSGGAGGTGGTGGDSGDSDGGDGGAGGAGFKQEVSLP